jgi:hypothetical protein
MLADADMAVMEQRNRSEAGADDLADECEWVNAWAARSAGRSGAVGVHGPALLGLAASGRPELAVVAGTDVGAVATPDVAADFDRDLLLACDVIEIVEARDALLVCPAAPPAQQSATLPFAGFPAGLGRTADSVPIILGGVLGFLMVLVFATAAMFVNFAR